MLLCLIGFRFAPIFTNLHGSVSYSGWDINFLLLGSEKPTKRLETVMQDLHRKRVNRDICYPKKWDALDEQYKERPMVYFLLKSSHINLMFINFHTNIKKDLSKTFFPQIFYVVYLTLTSVDYVVFCVINQNVIYAI